MTGMDELITWLRAQLDDDERVARAVRSGPWRTVIIPDRSGPDTVLELGGTDDRVVSTGFFDDDPVRPAEAEHIARWDPARVLAEIAAWRRILDLCVALGPDPGFAGEWELYPGDMAEMATRTILELAQPYAGRDGWREEWAA